MSFRPFTDVMILARSKVKYFGAYPAGFLQRARDMLAVTSNDQVLHVCSGRIWDYKCGPSCKGYAAAHRHGLGPVDITMDMDGDMNPDLLLDAGLERSYQMAIEQHPQIQAVLADPPYTKEFANEYKPGPAFFPNVNDIVRYSLKILPVGGRVGILSLHWPRYPKAVARQIALQAVYVGNGNLGRTFAVFERIA